MPNTSRVRVVFHGALVLLVGLLAGMPAVAEAEAERFWRTAHESLIMLGTLLIAVSSALPALELERREARGLVIALLATAWGFVVGLLLQAMTGEHAFGPSSSPILMVAFIGNATGILGSIVAASLVLIGARSAYRSARRAPAKALPAA